jgi:hypothetical protein
MKKRTLKLLPLLPYYMLVIIILSSPPFRADEKMYVTGANLLLQGSFFSDHDITLMWGPGYSIVLVPFIFLKLPLLIPKLLNAFFLFGAILYFYETLALWLNETYALIFAFAMGLYPPFLREVHLLMSENLVFFLICGFIFHFCKAQRKSRNPWLHLLLASIFLAYLAVTKVFFGYVSLVGLLAFLILHLWKKREEFRKIAYVYFLALIWCLPYLLSTYSLTGKVFYWGTSGGNNLYWMTTPYETQLGDWFSEKQVQIRPELAQHREFLDKVAGLPKVEQDSAYKKQGIYNITHYPVKYFVNWIANIGRLLFSYPFSYTEQKLTTYFYLIPNMFLVVLFVLSIYPAILRWKSIPYELSALLFFFLVSFGGTSLLSADNRQFRPLVPILILWLSFLYVRVMKIEVRPVSEITSIEDSAVELGRPHPAQPGYSDAFHLSPNKE